MLSKSFVSSDRLLLQSTCKVFISILTDDDDAQVSNEHQRALRLYEEGIVIKVCEGEYVKV